MHGATDSYSQTTAQTTAQTTDEGEVAPEEAQRIRLAISLCDLTSLNSTDTPERIAALVAAGAHPGGTDDAVPAVAAVCVHTDLVASARSAADRESDRGRRVKVAAACGAFPHGRASLRVKLADMRDAVSAGADELDIVIDRAALIAGDVGTVSQHIRAAREEAGDLTLKVIIETGELPGSSLVAAAARIALEAGADMIKTSTGKSERGAERESTRAVLGAVHEYNLEHGQSRGVKISGGVSASSEALWYMATAERILGPSSLAPKTFRLGASALLDDLMKRHTELLGPEPQP